MALRPESSQVEEDEHALQADTVQIVFFQKQVPLLLRQWLVDQRGIKTTEDLAWVVPTLTAHRSQGMPRHAHHSCSEPPKTEPGDPRAPAQSPEQTSSWTEHLPPKLTPDAVQHMLDILRKKLPGRAHRQRLHAQP